MDSPKFLIPPGKFDSTPRSRSQSVELPEFAMGVLPIMTLSEHHQKSNRKMSLSSSNSVTTGPPDVHVMVQPPSPVFVHPKVERGHEDQGLAALMRSRSGQQDSKP